MTKVSIKEACNLIAKMFNELEFGGRTDWQGEEIFNASPTGELFHVFEYYQIAKDYFDMFEEDRLKLKGMTIPPNGGIQFTVPETWRTYKLNEEQIKAVIELGDSLKQAPENIHYKHRIPIGGEIQEHTYHEFMALVNYLKGNRPYEPEEQKICMLCNEPIDEDENYLIVEEHGPLGIYPGKPFGYVHKECHKQSYEDVLEED